MYTCGKIFAGEGTGAPSGRYTHTTRCMRKPGRHPTNERGESRGIRKSPAPQPQAPTSKGVTRSIYKQYAAMYSHASSSTSIRPRQRPTCTPTVRRANQRTHKRDERSCKKGSRRSCGHKRRLCVRRPSGRGARAVVHGGGAVLGRREALRVSGLKVRIGPLRRP